MKNKTKITLQDYVSKDFTDDVYESLAPLHEIQSALDGAITLVHDTELNTYGVLNQSTGLLRYGQSLDHAIRIFRTEVKTNTKY
ncbi:MAG: hypothetical protein GKR88_19385 [Flavobacteriaceae bacterium]|nr:MAG: hypothetical protein GKR88_19385 [Flavobacteriaceae bacterium]